MQTSEWRSYTWLSIEPVTAKKLTSVVFIIICLTLGSGCAALFRPTTPVLHKPLSCDLNTVLNLRFPDQIDTLAGVPRTETVFQNGTNKFGGPLPDDIKEQFYLRKGSTEYTFIVFYSDTAAIKKYGRDRERHPVFREITQNGLTGRVHYTEEPRTDPEGGSEPMGTYISRADFRLHNLYIRVVTKAHVEDNEKPQNDKLSSAVKNLVQMLRESFSTNGQAGSKLE